MSFAAMCRSPTAGPRHLQIPIDSVHERSWGAEESKENDEGILLEGSPAVGLSEVGWI